MRALLLAGGLGTRLRPLTDSIPKCLVSINDTPLLAIWLDRLSEAGIGPFLVNTHYLAQKVEGFFETSAHRARVKLVNEPVLRGTAGTLIDNLDFFEGKDGMLIHADNYCLADFARFAEAHAERPAHCIMSMMTFRTDDPSSCGIVELDASGVVTQFHEKTETPPGNLANGAVYILSAALLEEIGRDRDSITDFSTQVLPRLIGKIFTFETNDVLLDIGTLSNYKKACDLARSMSGRCVRQSP